MLHERRLGTITGPIVLRDERGPHDARDHTWSGPRLGSADDVSVVGHEALFMLLVEKDTVVSRLCEDGFPEKSRCVLGSGNGYPGRAFRLLVRRLHEQLALPFYVLADNDPAGYKLFFLMAHGTARSGGGVRATLAIPGAAYVGVRVRDHESLGLSDRVRIELSQGERQQLQRLKSCSWLSDDAAWQLELGALLLRGFEVEMEALCSFSVSCLADTFLPDRLPAADHLRLPAAAPHEV